MLNATGQTQERRSFQSVSVCVVLLCAVGSAACGVVRIGSFPAPGTDCPTESDVTLVAELLGRESIGRDEKSRIELQATATRIADASGYCIIGSRR